MQGKPENIIFDLGNVIVDIDETRTFRALSKFVDEPATGQIPSAFRSLVHAYEQGFLTSSEFLGELQHHMPESVTQDQLKEAWNAMLLDIPQHRLDLMRQLGQSYGIYILSNTNELHLEWVNEFLQVRRQVQSFDDIVDYALYSHHAFSRKPQPEIYLELLEQANISAESALFFDDKPENIKAAKEAGISAKISPPNIDIRMQCAVFL